MTDHRKYFIIRILTLMLIPAFLPGCGTTPDSSVPDTATHPQIPTVLRATVTSPELNICSDTGFDASVVSTLKEGDTVTILEQASLEGIDWGRTEEGWICLLYVSMEEVPVTQVSETRAPEISLSQENSLYDTKIIVDRLNIRSGPSAKTEKVGEYFWGDTLPILEETDGWGRTELGWISLIYTYTEGRLETGCQTMQVRAGTLHVRKGPGTSYESLQELKKGEEVTILKKGTFGGRTWGYTGTGWLCMDYVEPVN